MPETRNLRGAVQTGVARTWIARVEHAKGHSLTVRRGLTMLLGAALSVGGVTRALEDVHFLVLKDLDQVKVVQQGRGNSARVVARIQGQFAANSVYKLARALPLSWVTQELDLFDQGLASQSDGSPLGVKLTFISDAISRQFYNDNIPFGDLIHQKARKYEMDPNLVAAVIEAESRFKRTARSGVGAQGLMQLMPRTGRWMGANNLYDADQNVEAGVKYLKYLSGRFDGDLTNTIAAYNAGEGTVRRYGGVPPYRETRTYVKKVLANYDRRNHQLKRFEASEAEADSGSGR